MKEIVVKASRQYSVLIENGIFSRAGALCREVLRGNRVCVVSDSNVAPLYGARLEQSLREAGFDPVSYTIPAGEESKNPGQLVALAEFLAEREFTRSDGLIALGGGVTGDLTGLCASLFLRGVGCVQIPTSVLAAVDSSVGGKTAVNLRAGKNLFGSFFQPRRVICDPELFQTLPPEIVADGFAEIVKYGMLADTGLFKRLEERCEDMELIVAECVEYKRQIVMEDEFDTGRRKLLNLGHTVGHAIEAASDFRISHGSAVAMGMVAVTCYAAKAGLCAADLPKRLTDLLESYRLPVTCPFSAEELIRSALHDKKREGDRIDLVIPREIGNCEIYPIPVSEMAVVLKEGLG
ncbi:MAG: 3-dehydroquinate synthase [Oscillospiraceae bacterium]|nr:3-dehydroquinate synthase [Oscillospiraceae bacterium]